MWLLGNITGEGEKYRDYILEKTNILEVLAKQIEAQKIGKTFLRTIVWVNSNLNRYKKLNAQQVEMSFSVAKAGLYTEDPEINSDCLWTISYLTDTDDDNQIDFVASIDVIVKICEFMGS